MFMLLGLIIFLAGAGMGLLLLKMTVFMLRKRVDCVPEHWLINGKRAFLIWSMISGAGCLVLYLFLGISLTELEATYIFLSVLVLSAVDIVIRKIPNSILLLLIAGTIGFILLNGSINDLSSHLYGMASAVAIFLIPFLFGRQAGAGDVKYAAVIGFSLGFYYTIIAFVIMSVFYLFYVAFLFISKRGCLKTQTAFGPYMSIGFLLSLLICRVS